MPLHGDYPISGPNYATDLFQSIEMTGAVQGFTYSNMLLSGNGIEDRLDPDHLSEADALALYFPGGAQELGGHKYVYYHLNSDGLPEHAQAFDTQKIRERTLGLTVGETALARYETSPAKEVAEVVKRRAMEMGGPVAVVESLMALQGLPMAIVGERIVRRSNVVKEGSRLAVLHYPLIIHPKIALRRLQQTLRSVIAEEKI